MPHAFGLFVSDGVEVCPRCWDSITSILPTSTATAATELPVESDEVDELRAELAAKRDELEALQDVVEKLRARLKSSGVSEQLPTASELFAAKPDGGVDETRGLELSFRIPRVHSGKNTKSLGVIWKGGKPIPRTFRNREAIAEFEGVQAAAFGALERACPDAIRECRPLVPVDDVAVVCVHNVPGDFVDVLVRRIGSPPKKGATGRRCDVHNIPEVILDAMQGFAFANDNQVARLEVWRDLCKREEP
jgi:hypothetical protein